MTRQPYVNKTIIIISVFAINNSASYYGFSSVLVLPFPFLYAAYLWGPNKQLKLEGNIAVTNFDGRGGGGGQREREGERESGRERERESERVVQKVKLM